MKKVIITGATSFIGRYLIEHLLKDDYEVYACVRPTSNRYEMLKNMKANNPNLKIIDIDMDDIRKLSDLLNLTGIETFYHLAWEGTRLPGREDERVQKKNYENTVEAIKVARKLGCTTFVGIGSQAEYGTYVEEVSELSNLSPVSQYGIYKLKSYEYAMNFANPNEMRVIWARVFSLYGIHDYDKSLIMSIAKNLFEDKSMPLTPCTQKWDYLHVKDAVRALMQLNESNCESGAYNIASGESKPLIEFTEIIRRIIPSEGALKYGEIPYREGYIVELCPNITKLKQVIGFFNLIPFEDGIKEIYEDLRGRHPIE